MFRLIRLTILCCYLVKALVVTDFNGNMFERIWEREFDKIQGLHLQEDRAHVSDSENASMVIHTTGTTLTDFRNAKIDNRITTKVVEGVTLLTLTISVAHIKGAVQSFQFVLPYHPQKPLNGNMTYTFAEYEFLVTCRLLIGDFCLNDCLLKPGDPGYFNAHMFYMNGQEFLNNQREMEDIQDALQASETTKINYLIFPLVSTVLKTLAGCKSQNTSVGKQDEIQQ